MKTFKFKYQKKRKKTGLVPLDAVV